MSARRRRVTERTAARIRSRQPLLANLVDQVTKRYTHLRDLLRRAAEAEDQELFVVDACLYRRVISQRDRLRAPEDRFVRVVDEQAPRLPATVGNPRPRRTINVTTAEDQAFWEWAVVETLRLSGVRAEELVELTQLSVRQYQRPNGEVIGLLVIAPSKTDRERVIPMSAELFAVIAAIIRRHTASHEPIPLVSRYDHHERSWSVPMPFLFQRHAGSTRAVMHPATINHILRRNSEALAETNPVFGDHRFSAHDFRRLFATELVNNGLPIHIGAALLGHLDLQTTRGYVGVFEEDLVRHYQQYLHARRQVRSSDEYGSPTSEEWAEFENHFDKRRVELGNCTRPYGTPCVHEHAHPLPYAQCPANNAAAPG